jgi:hypothetical protein
MSVGDVSEPVEVHSLLCHRDVEMALKCLGSCARYARDPLGWVIHDDGSLRPEDRERLADALGAVRFVDRAEADDRILSELRHRPFSLRFRKDHLFGRKLFDVYRFGDGDLAYCDSDVLFLRPFTGLYHWPDPRTGALMLWDVFSGYACTPKHLVRGPRFDLPVRANAGLFFFRRSAYDPDYIEWFLSQNLGRFAVAESWVEQTIWAGMGWRAGLRMWDRRQVVMLSRRGRPSTAAVAVHCATDHGRHRLDEFDPTASVGAPPSAVRTFPARRITPFGLAFDRLKLKVYNKARAW